MQKAVQVLLGTGTGQGMFFRGHRAAALELSGFAGCIALTMV